MPHESFHDLFVDELRDLWSAEKQLLTMLPRMAKAATAPKLRKAFTAHERQTGQHVKRLEDICEALDVSPRGKKCVGMEGLISEGKELLGEDFEGEVLDAGLIAAAQRVEHYEIAGYGTARTWAQHLGYEDHAAVLQQTLDEEAATDETLTALAAMINEDAESAADHDEEDDDVEEEDEEIAASAGASRSASRNKQAKAGKRNNSDADTATMTASSREKATASEDEEAFQPSAPLRDTRPGKKPK